MTKPVVLFIASMALVATGVFADPVQWLVSEGGNGHYYEAVDGPMSWNAAAVGAASLEWEGCLGHLATITSAAEDEFILTSVGGRGGFWLGATQQPGSVEPDGGWTWITGEAWDYTNWYPDEPNNDGDEKYLMTVWWDTSNRWNDEEEPPYDVYGFYVEYEPPTGRSNETTWGRVKGLYR
jgi:hypothetical protein